MYAPRYILSFTNEQNELYEIYFEFLDYTGLSYQILGTDDCLSISATGGDEDKFAPIIAHEATIKIWVTDEAVVSINELVSAHDNDIRISIYKDQNYKQFEFQGFVVVEDNSQPFYDPPFALTIRALDGLGLLKGQSMVDENGDLYTGIHSIETWVGNILHKTGLDLGVRFFFPFYWVGSNESHPCLYQTYINATTFQRGELIISDDPSVNPAASETDDAYTALEKICHSFRCRLFQQGGKWNMMSVYSYNLDEYYFEESTTANLVDGMYTMLHVAKGVSLNYRIDVGKNEIVSAFKDDAILYLKLATKWFRLGFLYDQSANKVCNQNFEQGLPDLVFYRTIPDETFDPKLDTNNTNQTLKAHGFDLFCWEHFNNSPGGVFGNTIPSAPPTKKGYVQEVDDFLGYQADRFMVLETNNSVNTYVKSTEFLIDNGDRIELSIQWRTLNGEENIGFGVGLHLAADDGTFWAAIGQSGTETVTNRFIQVDSNYYGSGGLSVYLQSLSIVNSKSWATASWGDNPDIALVAPISGTLTLYLSAPNLSDDNEYWLKNLTITIHPFLQGSYKELKGDYNFLSSNDDIKQTFSESVEISDSPKRYFKGALLKQNGDLIPPDWHRQGKPTEHRRFTEAMGRVLFNNLGRICQKIEGTFRGLVFKYRPTDISYVTNGFVNSWHFLDSDRPDKKFMLTSYDRDFATGLWRGVFVEVMANASDSGYRAPDQYQFKYVFN